MSTSHISRRWRRVLGVVLLGSALLATGVVGSSPAAFGQVDAPAPEVEEQFETTDWTSTRAPDAAFAAVAESAGGGRSRVIVGLQARFTPEGVLDPRAVDGQRASIATAREELTAALAGTDFAVGRALTAAPYVVLDLSPAALTALQRSGRAASVTVDGQVTPLLDSTTAVVEANETRTLGRTGAGRHVVVIDTGVAKGHPFSASPTP